MGANLEVDIFLKKENFSLKPIYSILEDQGFSIDLEEFSAFDGWKYANATEITCTLIELQASTVFLERFTRIYFILNNAWRCTLLTSLIDEIDDAYINLSFGLDTDDLVIADIEDINKYLMELYDRITDVIVEHVNEEPFKDRFLAAAMGVEYSVDFYRDISLMVSAENGGARWIVSEQLGKDLFVEAFTREKRGNTIVFTSTGISCDGD